MIRYRECRRNHAAHLGAHVVDGCGEFMAAGDATTPLALKCAACDCHRNFHRREIAGDTSSSTPPPPPPPPTAANCFISFKRPKPQPHYHQRSPVMVDFRGGAVADSSSEDINATAMAVATTTTTKRFRTKFTQEQKEKMMEFAEKIGWRITKLDDVEAHRFCAEIGVKRRVFNIWLHNNRQSIKRKNSS